MQTRTLYLRLLASLLLILMLITSFTEASPTTSAPVSTVNTTAALPTDLDISSLLENAGLDPAVVMPASVEADSDYTWHTFYGGSTGVEDSGMDIEIDNDFNIIITGHSWVSWNGPNGQIPLNTHKGSYDAFVLKLSSSGTYRWHTFHGGSGADYNEGVTLDSDGNIYTTGHSNYGWDGPVGDPPKHEYDALFDLYILKLSPSGVYQWHTFYGGSDFDHGYGITSDDTSVYVAGASSASWLGPMNNAPLHAHSGIQEAYVLKLSFDGSYQWHTFYGSSGEDKARSITFDSSGSGSINITGYSLLSWNGPGGETPVNGKNGGVADIFILKLSPGGAYQWHTFCGGTGNDYGEDLDTDSSGNIYLTGYSTGTWASPLNPYSGDDDIIVIKLASNGTYQWHTYYGALYADTGYGIAATSGGNVYITGTSQTPWDGPAGEPPLHAHSIEFEAFVLALSTDGTYQWHTFFGGAEPDTGHAIALDILDKMYISGSSYESWSGPDGQAPLNAPTGDNVAFILKLGDPFSPPLPPDQYLWGAFHGGTDADVGYDIAIASDGSIYITGLSYATWNGPMGQAPLNAYTGGADILLLKLSSSGTYQWHTFFGCSNDDFGSALVTDSSGDLYITGGTYSSWNGPADQEPLHTHSDGYFDVFVLHVNASGGYEWHTFYGGSEFDLALGIATDTSDNVYMTGFASTSWTDPSQIPLHSHSGNEDAVILKLAPDGSYQWHTFYGGTGDDYGSAIAITTSSGGCLYITGASDSAWTGPAGEVPLNEYSSDRDAIILKLSLSGAYTWHTYYGSGTASDTGEAITLDSSGNLYIAGRSGDTWNVHGWYPLAPYTGDDDIFVLKLSASGAHLWHTFYGGSGDDSGDGLVINTHGDGNLYITGFSRSSWNGPSSQAPENTYSDGADAFVLKLTSDGDYQWHTFYGGTGYDAGNAIAIASNGNICITGESDTAANGSSSVLPKSADEENTDVFILKMGEIHEMFLPLIRHF